MAAQSSFPLNPDGCYDYDLLDQFWEHPYLITQNNELAGFCLIISHCPIRNRSPCWFMAEFCVLRPYQGQGIGRAAVQAVLNRHPGDWEIAWSPENSPANAFWPKVIPARADPPQRIEFDGMDWTSVAFTSA